MALVKETIEDKIEIVGELKDIHIRTATVVKEGTDAKGYDEISRSFHRKVLQCVSSSYDGSSWTHTDTDVSSESDEVKGIAGVVWTDAVKAARRTANEVDMT